MVNAFGKLAIFLSIEEKFYHEKFLVLAIALLENCWARTLCGLLYLSCEDVERGCMTLITDRFPDGGVQHDDDQHQVDRRTGIMFVVRAMQEPTLEWSLALVASGLAHKHKTRLGKACQEQTF